MRKPAQEGLTAWPEGSNSPQSVSGQPQRVIGQPWKILGSKQPTRDAAQGPFSLMLVQLHEMA